MGHFSFPYRMRHVAGGKAIGLAILLLSLLAFSACSLYTVRPLNATGGQSNQASQQTFDPKAYANSIWDSKVVPTVVSKATELSVVLVAINVNTTSAEKQYGYEEGEGPYTFMVKGKGRVTAVQTGSENGTLSITPVPSLGKDQPEIVIQIGPVVTGTAIRDGVGFIHFEQFVNQIQYAQVADALNTHVPLLLGNTNPASLQGKTLTYYGLFQLVNPKRIVITPVKLEIGGNSQ